MFERFMNKYIRKSVLFKELPSNLQSSIIQRIISGMFIGIILIALGICSKSLTTLLLAILAILAVAIGCITPYYLATRDLLVQVSGVCTGKNINRFLNNKTYQLYIDSGINQVTINVTKWLYTNVRDYIRVEVYVIPKNIRENSGGVYMIENPLFVVLEKHVSFSLADKAVEITDESDKK